MIVGILQWAMRYQPEHKAETHQKIVKDASRRVRMQGMTGAAVSAVMRDAGLTHGGFYKHFESKDALLMESLSEAFREIADRLAQAAEQSQPQTAWKAIVKTYLSMEYCDHVEYGCPLPSLAAELARADKAMKPRIFEELKKYRSRMLQLKSLGCCQSPRCERKCWRAQETFSCGAFDFSDWYGSGTDGKKRSFDKLMDLAQWAAANALGKAESEVVDEFLNSKERDENA
jgi:TetR/AcrR family transcriptional regulator, transcriptional repressor for nem operon